MASLLSCYRSLLATSQLTAVDIRLLMMHALKKTRIAFIIEENEVLTSSQISDIDALIKRRQQGEPIAYIMGERDFFGLTFSVTPDVLIPRPETELLVEEAIARTPQHANLLDLGTGSGAIAVSVAHTRPDLSVWACDISYEALGVAEHNAKKHGCTIVLLESDWFSALPQKQWHTIVANPPYIEKNDPHLCEGDLRFEPKLALTDHHDGLSAYRHIIAEARHYLMPQGWLLVEHGYNQGEDIPALFKKNGFRHVTTWHDLSGIARVCGGQL